MKEGARKRGRPTGTEGKAFPAETRARARAIFDQSNHLAKDAAIAKQLKAEGFGDVPATNIGVWRRHNRWAHTEAKTRQLAELGEEMRQAVQVQVPDDLDRVEQASIRLASTGECLASHIERQIPKIKIESVADLEIATRCARDLLQAQLHVGKALQDLRLLRVSSAFGDAPRDGEIIPPDRRPPAEDHPPLNGQEAVISNFAG